MERMEVNCRVTSTRRCRAFADECGAAGRSGSPANSWSLIEQLAVIYGIQIGQGLVRDAEHLVHRAGLATWAGRHSAAG